MVDIIPIIHSIKEGQNISNKIKISIILSLRFLQKFLPYKLNKYFDYFGKLVIIETDVRFKIGTLNDFIVFSGIWEPQVQKVFNFYKKMVFLDIGAHIGKYSVRAGTKIGKEGKIIAIEPNKNNFELLVQNLKLNQVKNCIPLNIAAYIKDSEIQLFIGPESVQHSIKENSGRGSKKVKARALDNVLKELKIDKLDLIKIDVEGAEYEVIKGLEKTLTNQSPKLFLEILKTDQQKVLDYIYTLGYKKEVLYQLSSFKDGLMYYFFQK